MLKSNGTQEEFTNNINIADKITITAIIMGEAATITIHNPAIMVIKTTITVTETIIMREATIMAKHGETIMAEEETITVNDSPKNIYILKIKNIYILKIKDL